MISLDQIRQAKGKASFVNKKKQKNFVRLRRAGFNAAGPGQQWFLRRFFQKAAAFFVRHVGL
jgi:hypothetical protein